MIWGWLFLDEPLAPRTLAGVAIVVAGTGLAMGVVRLPAGRGQAAVSSQ